MFDIVLIPCYMRPEYLFLTLEYLSRAEGARDGKEYWVIQDLKYEDECRHGMQLRWTKEVLDASPLPIRHITRKPHGYEGNSYNTLEAYKEAYATDARFVHLIEEDVLVMPDYFLWHESIQAKEPAAMCSIAYRCSRNSDVRRDITDPAAYFISARDYASIGVCWRRENLKPIVEHACKEYYSNAGFYLDNRFPTDVYSGWFHEQDGLIMRVMHEHKSYTAWGYLPRCYHIGNVGYHRPNGRRADGQLHDKIRTLRGWISDREVLKAVAPDFGDIEPVPTTGTDRWSREDLHCIQRFE